MKLFVLIIALLLAGCVIRDQRGTCHYLVAGFGVVSVRTNNPCATVWRTTIIGAGASQAPGVNACLGLASSTVVEFTTNAQIAVEVSSFKPLSPLKVCVP